MTIRLHDTLSGETRPLVPSRDDGIGVYSCGPTVYGPAHIGNFRSFLFADLLVRFLRWRGEHVTWVMNITDIDDKIIRGAAATGESIETVAERYLAAFLADAAALRMTTPDVLPQATRHIDEIDQGPPGTQMQQAEILAPALDGAADDLAIEALQRRHAPHAEHDMVEAEEGEGRSGHRGTYT